MGRSKKWYSDFSEKIHKNESNGEGFLDTENTPESDISR